MPVTLISTITRRLSTKTQVASFHAGFPIFMSCIVTYPPFFFFSYLTRPTGRRRRVSQILENSRSKLPGSLDGNDGFSPTERGSRLLERASADSAAATIRGYRSQREN